MKSGVTPPGSDPKPEVAISIDPGATWSALAAYSPVLLTAFLSWRVAMQPKWPRRLTTAVVLSASAIALAAFIAKLAGDDVFQAAVEVRRLDHERGRLRGDELLRRRQIGDPVGRRQVAQPEPRALAIGGGDALVERMHGAREDDLLPLGPRR